MSKIRVALSVGILLGVAAMLSLAGVTKGPHWLTDSDPTIAPGVAAPANQELWRTDVPSIYYKSGPADTDWTAIGQGTPPTPQVVLNPETYWWFSTDFTGSGQNAACAPSGTYFSRGSYTTATCSTLGDSTNLAYFSLGGTNLNTGGYARAGIEADYWFYLGSPTYTITCRVQWPNLDDGTYSFVTHQGFAHWSSSIADPTDGVYWTYNHAAYGDHIAIESRVASVTTGSACGGAALVAGQWYTITLTLNGSTTATVSINGAAPCASVSTAALVGTGMAPGLQFYRTTTGLARSVYFNWCQGFASVNRG